MLHYHSLATESLISAGIDVLQVICSADYFEIEGERYYESQKKLSFYKRLIGELAGRGCTHLLSFSNPIRFEYYVVVSKYHGLLLSHVLHDHIPHDEYYSIKGRLVKYWTYKVVFRLLLRHVNMIHVHSSHQKDYLVKYYRVSSSSVLVHPHPIGIPPAMRQYRKYSKSLDKYFLFIGRVEEYKGISILEQAVSSLEARNHDVSIIVAGKNNNVSVKKLNSIQYIDKFISDSEFIQLVEQAHCVVLPYLRATQSGVVCLVRALGSKVIATRVEGLREYVDPDNSMLVTPGSVTELADALELVWSETTIVMPSIPNWSDYANVLKKKLHDLS